MLDFSNTRLSISIQMDTLTSTPIQVPTKKEDVLQDDILPVRRKFVGDVDLPES